MSLLLAVLGTLAPAAWAVDGGPVERQAEAAYSIAIGDSGWRAAPPLGFPAAPTVMPGRSWTWSRQKRKSVPGHPDALQWVLEERVDLFYLSNLKWAPGRPSPVPCLPRMRVARPPVEGRSFGRSTFNFTCSDEAPLQHFSRDYVVMLPGPDPRGKDWRALHLRYFRNVTGSAPGADAQGLESFRSMQATLSPIDLPDPKRAPNALTDDGTVPLLR